jgi:hypothetical protein
MWRPTIPEGARSGGSAALVLKRRSGSKSTVITIGPVSELRYCMNTTACEDEAVRSRNGEVQ